jgi:hypothetical protein
VTSVPTTGRYEEMAYHRHELDAVKERERGVETENQRVRADAAGEAAE